MLKHLIKPQSELREFRKISECKNLSWWNKWKFSLGKVTWWGGWFKRMVGLVK